MTTFKRDFYEVLGVGRDADDDTLKKAYRRLAKQYHPDTNKETGDDARFIEINEAYETLSDREKRDIYDRFGHAFAGETRASRDRGARRAARAGEPSDLFADFFAGAAAAGGKPRAQAPRGPDIRHALTIAFGEAAFGCQKAIELPHRERCGACQGRGAPAGTPAAPCGACRGTGGVRRVRRSIFGQYVSTAACERCGGWGHIASCPCEECRGQGWVSGTRRIVVAIPAGVDDGITVRIEGAGETGETGAPPGNLYLALTVQAHPFFARLGNDIVYELPISSAQAERGARVEVPTADGKTATLTIPAGTRSGSALRLRGRGVPVRHSSFARGDQHVIVRVDPTPRARERVEGS